MSEKKTRKLTANQRSSSMASLKEDATSGSTRLACGRQLSRWEREGAIGVRYWR